MEHGTPAGRRHESAADRDEVAVGRDTAADRQDSDADQRDVRAGQRDGRAARHSGSLRDRLAVSGARLVEELERAAARPGPPTTEALDAIRAALDDVRDAISGAHDDRRAADSDRSASRRDRHRAALDRGAAARDRVASAVDRDQDDIERQLTDPPPRRVSEDDAVTGPAADDAAGLVEEVDRAVAQSQRRITDSRAVLRGEREDESRDAAPTSPGG